MWILFMECLVPQGPLGYPDHPGCLGDVNLASPFLLNITVFLRCFRNFPVFVWEVEVRVCGWGYNILDTSMDLPHLPGTWPGA